MAPDYIFHACTRAAWEAAKSQGVYSGSADDRRDGFIHFSDRTQIVKSTQTHHAGEKDLVLLVVATARLDEEDGALRWEVSRHGQLFPHLYGALPTNAVTEIHDLPLDGDNHHQFPDLPGGASLSLSKAALFP